MIKTKKQMFLVIGAFALVMLLGTVTYAFFNYTRTGGANTVRTGRIAFNTVSGPAINLTDAFPVDVTNGIPNNNANVGSVTINVTGDTTYGDGIEYLVSAVNVQNTIGSGANQKTLPISIDVSVASNTNNDPATTLGTADSDYFTNRGANANTSIYKVLAGEVIANNDQLVVGYIKSGATGVDGNIVIRAYLDASKIAISDTYPEGTVHTVKTTGYSSNSCETVLTGVTNASTYCATSSSLQSAIDNGLLTNAQITLLVSAGIVEEYTNGTTSTWVGDRTVLTTSEWNSLQANGVSFQVKVEANEGIWVEDTNPPAIPTIDTCPGCVFKYTTSTLNYGVSGTVLQVGDYDTNYSTTVTNSGKPYFLGLILENGTSGKVTRAFACGIKGENPNQGKAFCVEGKTDGSLFTSNKGTLTTLYGAYDSNTGKGCQDQDNGSYVDCGGAVGARADDDGYVNVSDDDGYCYVVSYDSANCY